MSKPTTGLRRAGIASFATGALALSACVVGAGAASADADFAFERIAGDNRYETAGEVYDAFGESDSVILANGEQGHYPDALVANYLAGVEGSPILLTRSDKMPEATQSRLDAADKNITIVGGEGVVSAEQEAALEADGHTVTRLSGDNRYETAAAVIDAAGDAASSTALISTGVDFPDALAAGPVSYDQGSPLAISRVDDIHDAEVAELVESGVSQFIVVGGPNVVGPEVIAELEAAGLDFVTRLAGADRAATSVAVANYAIENYGFTDAAINVASGYVAGTGADALAGGPLSGKNSTANLITRNVNNPGDSVLAFLKEHANTLSEGNIFGGPGAVSEAAETAMEAAARSVSSNQDYTVTPSGAQNVEDDEVQQFSVSGIEADEVLIRLFDCTDVQTDENGVVTFDGTNPGGTGNVATDSYAGGADIAVIDGEVQGDNNGSATADSSDGSITFTVDDAVAGDCYVPVVFADADDDGRLDLNADGEPTEEFGVGAETNVLPAEFAGTTIASDQLIESVDLANDVFSTDAASYYYDSNDEFQVDSDNDGDFDTVTLAQFESVLSVGDELEGQFYRDEASGQSVFQITDLGPDPVDAVSTETASGTNQGKEGIQLTFDESDTDTVESYDVYRSLATQPTVTGQDVTCTENLANYTKIGSVEDDDTGSYEFFDGTAQAPATTGGEDPSYCYAVVAVDETGDVSDPTFGGPFQAAEADPGNGAPLFKDAEATAGSQVITVVYDEAIDDSTIDGSEFAVRVTDADGNTQVASTVVFTTGTTPDDDTIVLTITGVTPATGDTVRVDVNPGETDGDTVADSDEVFQPADDAVVDEA